MWARLRTLLVRLGMLTELPAAKHDCYSVHPEDHVAEMRRELRTVVHDIRNNAQTVIGENAKAKRASRVATSAAHAAIFKLEEMRRARKENEVPPN
jgi:predicted sulfurtransferase